MDHFFVTKSVPTFVLYLLPDKGLSTWNVLAYYFYSEVQTTS